MTIDIRNIVIKNDDKYKTDVIVMEERTTKAGYSNKQQLKFLSYANTIAIQIGDFPRLGEKCDIIRLNSEQLKNLIEKLTVLHNEICK